MSESWLQNFESSLDALEKLVADDGAQLDQLLAHANTALATLASTSSTTIWLVKDAGAVPTPNSTSRPQNLTLERLQPDGRLEEVDAADHADVVAALEKDHHFSSHHAASGSSVKSLCVRSRVAADLNCVLQLDYDREIAPQPSLVEGCRAVVGIVTAFVARHLLSQYEIRLQSQSILVHLVTQLQKCESTKAAASVIAQEGAAHLGASRVSVLVESGGQFDVAAISGVREVNKDSEAARAIRDVATSIAERTTVLLSESADASYANSAAVLQQNGTTRCITLKTEDDSGSAVAITFVEFSEQSTLPDERQIEQLCTPAEATLRALHRSEQSYLSRHIKSRRTRWTIAAVLSLLILAAWPTSFEIEVPGQIIATNHQRIFAPENGVIQEVNFSNEQLVDDNADLLQLSNADIDLELRRLQGEIDTTMAEHAAVSTQQRTTGDVSLSPQIQRLAMQVKNLKAEQSLVESRRNELTIQAPFSGRVFRHNPQQELMLRPVQRGQLLLEIVPNDGKWHLDLSIPARLENYLRDHLSTTKQQPTVRYVVRAAPDADWTTTLTTVENAVQIVNGEMTCRAIADIKTLPDIELRPGTSITARIYCGNRSVGFVWFREVIEFWQQLRFAWF